MNDCPDCMGSKKVERPRQRKRRYRAGLERRRRHSPEGCNREDLRCCIPCKPRSCCSSCEPCLPPCSRKCCSSQEPGFLGTIRASIQKLFSGRRPNQLYTYSMSQLKCIEQLLDELEAEICCVADVMKQAMECECSRSVDCDDLKCSLSNISDRIDSVKCDLMSAKDCYDPCRDKCEFEFICCLMEKVCSLESLVREICLELECLRAPCCAPCRPSPCRRCCSSKPCERSQCCRQGYGNSRPSCSDKCCGTVKLSKLGNICRQKGLCGDSSVMPLGVMLVKL